jgi:hypothetical protein
MPVLTPHLALTTQTARHKIPDGAARAATLTDRISLAVAWALKSCDLPREEVACRMSAHLVHVVSVNILHGYAAQSKLDHRITLERFMALIPLVR